MPPKAKAAPKPVDFPVIQLRAGKRVWREGNSGPSVKLNMESHPMFDIMGVPRQPNMVGKRSRREVVLLGKVLFGRQRFAFEVQEIDYDPVAVKKLVAKEKKQERERFGDPFGYGGFSASEDERDDCPEWLLLHKAKELAPKHSLQIKFGDITSIETCNDVVTLHLSSVPACYLKPAGEISTGNMEVCTDITGGAKTISFTTKVPDVTERRRSQRSNNSVQYLAFADVQQVLTDYSPRLAALFRGLPPPAVENVATPSRKKRSGNCDNDRLVANSTQKRLRVASVVDSPLAGMKCEKVEATEGTWLAKAVALFDLRAPQDAAITEMQWQKYVKEREGWELANCEDHESSEEEDGCFGDEDERESDAVLLERIRKTVADTVSSTSLPIDPKVVARGAVLTYNEKNDADEGEPRTATAHARFYSPLANGRYVELRYENHCRVRQSFTERDSYLYVRKCGPLIETPQRQEESNSYNLSRRTQFERAGFEKLFELDYNEFRKKNQVKTTVATNAVLASLGAHLFGSEGVLSNRKIFGLLVRSVGVGQYKERNGWPIAVMRRRFKCAKGEQDTDTERILGDRDEEPSMGGCSMM